MTQLKKYLGQYFLRYTKKYIFFFVPYNTMLER